MVKKLFNTCVALLILSSASYAGYDEDAGLRAKYGPDLTRAPFHLRYSFSKSYQKDWYHSYYLERKEFLQKYEIELIQQARADKINAKAQKRREKELLNQQRAAKRAEEQKVKEALAEQKAEAKEEKDRQHEFDQAVKVEQKEMKQMERAAGQGGI